MKNLIFQIKKQILPLYDESEARAISVQIAEKICALKKEQILASDEVLTQNQKENLNEILQKILKKMPLQYALNQAFFCDLEFFVDERVLIPRPETAELVRWALADGCAGKRALDICTGSGCIAVALSKIGDARLTAIDVSSSALEVAKKNADFQSQEIDFQEVDIFEIENFKEKFEIIISNPPYVCENEKAEIQPQVLDFEPHIALFVPDSDPLKFYKRIADFALENLEKNGRLYFEINRRFGAEIVDLLRKKGFSSVELKTDFFGNSRMIKAIL